MIFNSTIILNILRTGELGGIRLLVPRGGNGVVARLRDIVHFGVLLGGSCLLTGSRSGGLDYDSILAW